MMLTHISQTPYAAEKSALLKELSKRVEEFDRRQELVLDVAREAIETLNRGGVPCFDSTSPARLRLRPSPP